MFKLSLNIPTYNRCLELQRNLDELVSQIRVINCQDSVEINISDNGSLDKTSDMIKSFLEKNQDIHINYRRMETNQGPDANFITAMKMANGEYSILYGDDDYLIEGGMKKILELITFNPEVPMFLTNRMNINHKGGVLGVESFLREDIQTRIFDFSSEDTVRSYFSLCNEYTLGGCLSFISSVIYKTDILKEVGEYDNHFTGTNYAFLYYWWNYLLKGNKLLYCNEYFLYSTTSGATNNNYGSGLKRILVDVKGISKVAELVFVGDKKKYRADFLAAANKCNSNAHIFNCFLRQRAQGYNELLPNLSLFGWSERKINEFLMTVSWKNLIIGIIGIIIRKHR